MEKVLEFQIIEALHEVYDPEIPVNVYDLGLIYKIDIKEDNSVDILMTLTAPACPVAGDIVFDVQNKVQQVAGVKEANVQLTFEPQWTMEKMS